MMAACFIGLVGCISFGKTPTEFRQRASGTVEFSTPLALRPTYEIIKINTERCQTGDAGKADLQALGRFTMDTTNLTAETNIDEASGSATIDVRFRNVAANTLMQDIVLTAGAGGTHVIIYKLNDKEKWTTAALAVQGWLSGETACYKR